MDEASEMKNRPNEGDMAGLVLVVLLLEPNKTTFSGINWINPHLSLYATKRQLAIAVWELLAIMNFNNHSSVCI